MVQSLSLGLTMQRDGRSWLTCLSPQLHGREDSVDPFGCYFSFQQQKYSLSCPWISVGQTFPRLPYFLPSVAYLGPPGSGLRSQKSSTHCLSPFPQNPNCNHAQLPIVTSNYLVDTNRLELRERSPTYGTGFSEFSSPPLTII